MPARPVRKQLSWKIAAAFALSALIALGTVLLLGLGRESERLVGEQRESDLRLAQHIGGMLDRGLILANTLANVAQSGKPSSWSAQLQRLVFAGRTEPAVAALGIWPEPRARSGRQKRESRYWLVGADSALHAREDYNHPDVIAYHGEAWYTPARLLPAGRCYWTPVYREPLTQLEVVTCSLALRVGKRFDGVVTVSLNVAALEAALREAARSQTGYSILVDRENRLIAAGGLAENQLGAPPPRNLAELAYRQIEFNPVALAVHRLDEAFLAPPQRIAPSQIEQISKLSEATRNFSRQEAESVLALVRHLPQEPGSITAVPKMIRIKRDPLIGEASVARVLSLDEARWKLIRVTAADEASGGELLSRVLPAAVAAVLLSLLLAYAGVHLLMLRPLARLKRGIALARRSDPAVFDLPRLPDDEIGALGRDFAEQAHALRESAERLAGLKAEVDRENQRRRKLGWDALRPAEKPKPVDPPAVAATAAPEQALWATRVRAALEHNRLHLTTQWIEPSRARAAEGEIYAVCVALEDEEGFWTERAGFIDLLDSQELAARIDGWMLSRTVESLARDPQRSQRLAFCLLELTAGSVPGGRLLDVLARLLQEHENLSADKLCFAINRRLVDETGELLPKFCTALRAMGCRIALHHELGESATQREQLRRIPATLHSLDAGRHPDLATDALDQIMAQASIRAAQVLDRRVLVRSLAGDDAVAAWLKIGADYVQGPAVGRTSPTVFSRAGSRAADSLSMPT